MKTTYSIYNILDTIEKRPGMYIGEISLKNLKTYLHGYEMAMEDAGVEDISIPKFYEFHEFTRKKLGYYEATTGWANMILAATIGHNTKEIYWEKFDSEVTAEQHKESIKQFYRLLREYREKNA